MRAWSKTVGVLALKKSGESEVAAVLRTATEGMGLRSIFERLLFVWPCVN